jgi:glycosyltransferase involved in cell wall biosynthesis
LADRPQLTVAIPTCNGARHLAEALAGILAQEGVDFEVVVSDDRSEDQTVAIVAALAGDRARVEVNSERLGLAGNWNRCVALARAPLVTIFHQDDIMRPCHLAAHAAVLLADSELGMAASAADLIDDAGRAITDTAIERGGLGPVDRVFAPGTLASALAVGNPLRCAAVTIRAAAHGEAGGFDPSYQYVVDWDFWLRLARRRPVAWLAAPTVAVRWHAASETHRFKSGTVDLDEERRLLDGLDRLADGAWPELGRFRRVAERRLARAFLNRAHDALRGGDAPLGRRCLKRALELSPRVLATIARDPRLCVQMAALSVAPEAAGRWFGRRATV